MPRLAPWGRILHSPGRFPIITSKKGRLHRLIIERLKHDLAVLSTAAKTAHEAAIHEENIPDNKYDTLSLEASYVAQGQANRAQELKRALQCYQKLDLQQFTAESSIRLTALVTLEAEDGAIKHFFIGPQEGGLKLQLDDEEILVITPGSPLGSDLIGKSVGDEVALGSTSYEIVEVC
jgi:transcription elongation GreA/GreB family factor